MHSSVRRDQRRNTTEPGKQKLAQVPWVCRINHTMVVIYNSLVWVLDLMSRTCMQVLHSALMWVRASNNEMRFLEQNKSTRER